MAAEQAKKRLLEKEARTDGTGFTWFLPKAWRLGGKTNSWKSVVLAFSSRGLFKVHAAHFTWHGGLRKCSVLSGFPIEPRIIHS